MVVSRELVDRWVAGWCASRGMLVRRDGDGRLVEVAAETRSREYVIAEPSLPELRRLTAAVTAPDVWLTIVGDLDKRERDAVAGLDPVTSDERMMTTRLRRAARPPQVRIETSGRVAHARIEAEGEVAARGQAALSGGGDVVFDRIETTPRFRRRGLGGLVMTGLSAWAAENGATTGLLMASVGGRALYSSLGWTEVAPIVTLRGRAAGAAVDADESLLHRPDLAELSEGSSRRPLGCRWSLVQYAYG
ncbi:GNAT family N-acetyltransferase [Rathayibacter sp. VKM Ac-2928]|uniref:GNAT family N-acetyltransferase n=1 Tax=Rathayibacter sp. VKM Ac-2928 TaxID=2929479 RepID=UPI001FB3C671|nr:GNAT family N-acetyltransferase [Rathayibacter sp. VKM Ac-2928]MCJ1682874.1 GNAT family N-acetyltransferase [Rathayibacter sp. VKM Ac-2928]